jgi:hypothetical protein
MSPVWMGFLVGFTLGLISGIIIHALIMIRKRLC